MIQRIPSVVDKLAGIVAVALFLAVAGFGQANTGDKPQSKLRIEITAGDKSVPVDMASVYVKFVVKDATRETKDQKFELNLKTNREGIASLPLVPRGKVIIQVIAPGWKTFGQVYDITDDEQVVRIHLEKPPRWY
jgi:hypothetical protein